MGFFQKYKKQIITIVTVLLVISALFTTGRKMNATFIDNTIGFVVTPFQKLTTGIEKWVGGKISISKNKNTMVDENKKLKKKVAELEADKKRLKRYDVENKKLSELLKIAQKFPDYDTIGAEIIAKDPGNWYDIFLISKGKKQGLSANMVLTAPGGVVGKIIESGHHYSKAQSILDSRSSVSAMSLRTGDLGVVKGEYSLMDHGLCRMEYIDAEAEIMEGDEIVTSHLSDIYPPGLSIGKVKEIKTDANGLTKYAIIEPFVDFKHLDTVLVISKHFNKDTSEVRN